MSCNESSEDQRFIDGILAFRELLEHFRNGFSEILSKDIRMIWCNESIFEGTLHFMCPESKQFRDITTRVLSRSRSANTFSHTSEFSEVELIMETLCRRSEGIRVLDDLIECEECGFDELECTALCFFIDSCEMCIENGTENGFNHVCRRSVQWEHGELSLET